MLTERARHLAPRHLRSLRALERKILWLSTWMIHHANRVRPAVDGLKVGGHQASSASVVSLMTALYLDVLRPEDRVAVKPHASPVFHAIQYLFGHVDRGYLERFRAVGGPQSYPSRTKDADDVDFSTGSVGLGVAMPLFAALAQDYLRCKALWPEGRVPGRMIALCGDAEFDEGNVFEAMLEGWKHDVRNLWLVVDYNRQSLDSIVTDRLFGRLDDVCRTTGFEVVTLKYGGIQRDAFARPGGQALRRWIDEASNSLYSALTFLGGPAWRARLLDDLGDDPGIRAQLEALDDAALHRLMTNLGGHDLDTILGALRSVPDDRPRCFLAYTIKGYGLPLAGHKDNHAGLLTDAQMAEFKQGHGIADGREWEPFEGLEVPADELREFLASAPLARAGARRLQSATVDIPAGLPLTREPLASTQTGFGRILADLASGGGDLADRIVTTSPDVTVSTNLGGWVSRRGVFDRQNRGDVFRELQMLSAQRWALSVHGQHIELGIAEHNLFLALAALGLSSSLFGVRLFPIGTLYDPFVLRGLDALNYACYQDARFMVVGTPSGITLAPEGGAHQSVITPLVALGQHQLASFEPAYVDELATLVRWGFLHMQAPDGGSIYLRLTTRPIPQPERTMSSELEAALIAGGYWVVEPAPGAELAIVYAGAVAPEAREAHALLQEDLPGAGLLAVTSPSRLHAGWLAAQRAHRTGGAARSHVERLLAALPRGSNLVTVIDGHPATLSWLGAVNGHGVEALGVDRFGQSGDIPSLYRLYGLDVDAILDAVAACCRRRQER